MKSNRLFTFSLSLLLFWIQASATADDYSQRRAAVQKRDAKQRRVPVIPPKEQKLHVIIDTDARNEIDDIWAIALAVRSPERFQIEGFVAANYDNENPGGGLASIETSARAIETVLEKAGLPGKLPIKRGSPPMRYQFEPSESEGVDFIIERAMASMPRLYEAIPRQPPVQLAASRAATRVTSKADLLARDALKTAQLRDGTFAATVFGYSDNIRATVTVRKSRIESVNLDHREKADLGARTILPERIVRAQGVEVDGITGATITSQAIKSAVFQAIKQSAGL